MPRDHQLETFIPSEHLAFVGNFCVHGPMLFPHPHQVDARRECDAVRKLQSKGKSFEAGGPACCFLVVSHLFVLQLSEVTSGVAYLHELKVVHGDLKGVSPTFLVFLLPY